MSRIGRAYGKYDDLFQIPVAQTIPHSEIHEKRMFDCWFVDETLADNATIVLAFKTGAGTKRMHMWAGYTTLVGGELQVYEAATWTAQSGTEQAIINRFRETTPDSSVALANQAQAGFVAANVMVANPTGVGIGSATLIHEDYSFGVKNKIHAGGGRDEEEQILKVDTQYVYRFTANGGSNKAQISLNWYEHTDD